MKNKPFLLYGAMLLLGFHLNAQTTLINNGANWSYFDNQSEPANQGSNDWNDLAFDASSWSSGNAHLGYGDGDEATVLNSATTTAYFRHDFNVNDPSIYNNLDLNLTYDDGAVVYINGTEVWRVNMPGGTINYSTFASSVSSDNSQTTLNILNNLVTGTNVLAVEIHQESAGSSDVSFDFSLTGNVGASATLINNGANWSYFDNQSEPANQGANDWNDAAFDASSWSSGNAHLGYGDGDEATVLNSATTAAYFRHSFNVNDPSIYSDLDLNLTYDDGAVVYINGTEVWRVNMPGGTISYSTFASSVSSENSQITLNILNNLVIGTNVLAVEVHQESVGSSDISFDFSLTGNVIVPTDLINNGANWSYFDNQSEPANQGANDWNDAAFDASSWSSGNAHLGYGDGDEATVLNNATTTAYFRHSFNVNNPSAYDNLDLNLTYDDGAVVYINGTEVWRVNMPGGTINYSTFASSTSPDNSQITLNVLNNLVIGTNVLAVEVHQRSASSSDLSFDFSLTGNVPGGVVNVTRGPYLQNASTSSMVVRWRTQTVTESIINYGTTMGNLNQQASDLTPKTEHELLLTGLSADTKYFYQISNSSTVLVPEAADLYFQTTPNIGNAEAYTFWILGDCGTGNTDQRNVRDAYYNYIGSNHTDAILFLGDNAYNDGTDAEYQNAVFNNMYEDKLKNSLAYSCLGNHDGFTADSDSQTGPYYDIFTFPTAGEGGGLASGTEAYYSFDYGNIHFIALESYETDRTVNGPMYTWALNDIQNTTQEWIVAFWHHPPYTKGSHNSDSETNLIDMRQNFLPMLESNGVDLVLSGHSHSYERSYFLNGHYGNSNSFDPLLHTIGVNGDGDGQTTGTGAYDKQTTGSDANKGAVYITTGSAGRISGGSLDHEAMFYSVSQLGSCVLEVNGNQLDVKFVRETGAIDDYFTIIKDSGCTPGASCNDQDNCTINDVYDNNCSCVGTYTDNDGDGYCIGVDPDDNDDCNPDNSSPTCDPCATIITDGFESGYGNWNDGGSDCSRRNSNANNGTYSVRLRDNSLASSSTWTDNLDLTAYTGVTIDFSFISDGMENGEDFLLEVSTNGGSSYALHTSWVSGTDFQNDIRYNESLTVNGIAFSNNTRFRFRCDASSNNDRVYIDDIVLSGCIASGSQGDQPNTVTANSRSSKVTATADILAVLVYPNPAQDRLYLDLSALGGAVATIRLVDVNSRLIYQEVLTPGYEMVQELSLENVPVGIYFVQVDIEHEQPIIKKIVISR